MQALELESVKGWNSLLLSMGENGKTKLNLHAIILAQCIFALCLMLSCLAFACIWLLEIIIYCVCLYVFCKVGGTEIGNSLKKLDCLEGRVRPSGYGAQNSRR